MRFIANRLLDYGCGTYGSNEYGSDCVNGSNPDAGGGSGNGGDSIIGLLPVSGTTISVILIVAGILIISGVLLRHFAKKRKQIITD